MSSSVKNIASDNNKNKEELDDCRCVGSSNIAGSGGGGGSDNNSGQQPQQQQLNVFGDNNKLQTEQDKTAKAKQLELEAASETGDSGFISGPHTSSQFEDSQEISDVDDKIAAIGGDNNNKVQKFNILPTTSPLGDDQQQQHKKLQQEESITLDSGCIDEEFTEDDHEEVAATAATVATSAASSAVPSSASAEQMLFKQNVDAGMSEWFCNLSLDSDTLPRSQQPQMGGGSDINNFNAASGGRRSMTLNGNGHNSAPQLNRSLQLQQQQQVTPGGPANSTPTTSLPTNSLTPANAWEKFYQQDDEGDTPLHLACISGYVDVVAALIRMAPHPCLFNIQNDAAQSPLHLAALTAQPKILRMLLIAGAEPTIRDFHGNTALHLACLHGEEQCVRALTIPISASEINEAHRQYGHRSNDKTVSYLSCAQLPSDMEIRNYDGERCVHLTARAGHIDILRILALYGADINAREGKSGLTPLHIAIQNCNEDLVNFLLDECQNLNLETSTYAGLTAYQVAYMLNKSQMLSILEKRGAELLTPPDSEYEFSDTETDIDDPKSTDRFGDPGYFSNYNGGNTMTVA